MILELRWRRFTLNFPILSRTLTHLVSNQDITISTTPLPYYQQQSYMEVSQKFFESMKACGYVKSIPVARKLHAQLISVGLDSSVFLQNHLLNLYSKCGLINDACRVFDEIGSPNVFSWNTMVNGLADSGRIKDAEKVFNEMPDRDSVSWNSMMSGYFHNGKPGDTIKVFVSMVRDGECAPDLFSFSCAMKSCGSLGYSDIAVQLHGLVKKFNFGRDAQIDASIMDMYIKCGAVSLAGRVFVRMHNPSLFCWNSMVYGYSKTHGVQKALYTFNQMPERDSVSWNTIISVLSQQGSSSEAMTMFVEMWNQGFSPSLMTYASVLSACTSIFDLQWGSHLHALIIRTEPSVDVHSGSGLIDMYAKCGRLESARRVFEGLTERNAVSWTSLIGGVAHYGFQAEALTLFNQMKDIPVAVDEFTLATVFGACSSEEYIYAGTQLHSHAIKKGMDCSVAVGNAIITMYSKCGDTPAANHAFNLMPIKDIISWTALIWAFSQSGAVERARNCFDQMPVRNIITWNSMISTYKQYGFQEDGLKLYCLMRREGIYPDWVTFASTLGACADLAVLKLGTQIAAQTEKLGFASNVSVANSLISMYSRCGQIYKARKVFDSIATKNLISWNTLMAGYAQNGQGRKVIESFENLLKTDCAPDHISYLSVLSGCSHAGLVVEGIYYFISMTRDFGISPTFDHYSSVVDLLGRAGLLEQAKNMIGSMPFNPNADIWGALLGACRIHRNTKLAEYAMNNWLELEPTESGSYVLLANTYSACGDLEGVVDVRKLMRSKKIQKNPGCSWIEVDNRMHVFTVNDTSHPQISYIIRTLKDTIKRVQDSRIYMHVGFDDSRLYHSEKLAVAFGLMSLPSWMPIIVYKNLRICSDCHVVMKLISLVALRELIVRDGHRFHHFKGGVCSCRDYW